MHTHILKVFTEMLPSCHGKNSGPNNTHISSWKRLPGVNRTTGGQDTCQTETVLEGSTKSDSVRPKSEWALKSPQFSLLDHTEK